MKELEDILNNNLDNNLFEGIGFKPFKFITEADDEGGDEDPFGGDDMGGDDDDPFADEGGDESGDDEGGEDGDENKDGGDDDKSEEDENATNFEDHEDDPDFTKGVTTDNVVLYDSPAGQVIYDSTKAIATVNELLNSLPSFQLKEYQRVKKIVELIFNGKMLKEEDVQFEDTDNASFLINEICKKLDEKTKTYLLIKVKKPLLAIRDKQKAQAIEIQNDVDKSRDVLDNIG